MTPIKSEDELSPIKKERSMMTTLEQLFEQYYDDTDELDEAFLKSVQEYIDTRESKSWKAGYKEGWKARKVVSSEQEQTSRPQAGSTQG